MYFEDLQVGDPFPILKKDPISRVQLVRFAGASGDFNPLHTVEEVGEQAGTGIIAHGMLIMGMLSQGVTTWIPRKNIKRIQVRFSKMTYPGESIEIVGRVIEKKDDNLVVGEVLAKNCEGDVKVSGIFEAVLPSTN
ncbi:MaoC/PaaZ C-terminal domain-containing protein [Neobacillus sp. CF12]|uniref:MaoC family dehydratase n=1 Tax=Neobacillus sp. CF12 TaxID=3055864 RepID=UPI0025A132FC|nr:MaoC/PaaZ C-terminal domain-containing protein [Neobacillus sp. CF12]MDM5331645.1 MaoC/PaaZ C-terminal domain-containing protein [Neobacillus sp. CF12]